MVLHIAGWGPGIVVPQTSFLFFSFFASQLVDTLACCSVSGESGDSGEVRKCIEPSLRSGCRMQAGG
jgi:hypothetical protein